MADRGPREPAPRLVELLRCPVCDGRLTVAQDEALCTPHGHRFPVTDGIVVMTDESALESNPHYNEQRRYFDSEFSKFSGYELEPWRQSYLRRLRAGRLVSRDATPMVDIGVGGSGFSVIEAARLGVNAIGCDLSLVALEKARHFAVAEGVVGRTLWICCSAERLPIASDAFASVLAIAVIEHVPDDLGAVREAARILRPGGLLWVTVPHSLRHVSPWFRRANRLHDRRLGHLRRYSDQALVDLGRAAGLQPVDVQFTGHGVKVLQLGAPAMPGRFRNRFWWWCEARDLHRLREPSGSMQLSVTFRSEG